jgi:hypothetical protein
MIYIDIVLWPKYTTVCSNEFPRPRVTHYVSGRNKTPKRISGNSYGMMVYSKSNEGSSRYVSRRKLFDS